MQSDLESGEKEGKIKKREDEREKGREKREGERKEKREAKKKEKREREKGKEILSACFSFCLFVQKLFGK